MTHALKEKVQKGLIGGLRTPTNVTRAAALLSQNHTHVQSSPLSQELLNSVRRAKSELRRTTGSEPKKLMDMAEYRSFPVQQEQDMRQNSWRSIIHNEFKQSLI